MGSSKDSVAARLEKIQPVSGIRAIAPNAEAEGLHLESPSAVARQNSLDQEEARAFEEAGWRFARTENKAGDSNVVVDNDGRLKVVSDMLNVKFDPSMSRSDVESTLKQYGLSVRRELKFSPNLFTVSGSGPDAMDKARTLNNLDKVLYAEPVLIEAVSQRGR
jgi:hypothetical protein